MTNGKFDTFEEWFEALTPEQQKEYIEDMEADRAIDEIKSFPIIDNN